jgi:ParB family chromosome partitioning protein
MVENGSMKATVGYKIWAKMSQEEQEKFFEEIGREKLKTMTQKTTEEYINKINEKEKESEQLKQKLEKERNKPKEKEYITETIDNTDYTILNKLNKIEEELKNRTIETNKLKTKLELMTDKAEAYKQDSEDYQKMKEDITYLTKQKDDLGRQLQTITDISGLVVEIDHFIKEKLAPIKYSKSLLEAKDDEIVLRNLSDIVQIVQQWCDEIKEYIPNKINYVEVIE